MYRLATMHSVTDGRTDRRQHDANSRSYYCAIETSADHRLDTGWQQTANREEKAIYVTCEQS